MVATAPVVLVILDGWGYRESREGNAIAGARTPVMDSLFEVYPHTLLSASGRAVGLPADQMGNSEVGHLTLGSGRVVPQELVRISDAAEDGSLACEPILVNLCQTLKQRGGRLHLVGLCSDGGVHSHLDHLIALVGMAQTQAVPTYIHAITDGRDTPPRDGIHYLQQLQDKLDYLGFGRIVTLSGRYYAMDRDRRWDRTQRTYDVMVSEDAGTGQSITEAIQAAYAQDFGDEFIPPIRIAPGAVAPGDGVVFFNFRPDRARQLTQAFVVPEFNGFNRELIPHLDFVTLTQYGADLPVKVVFEPQNLNRLLGEVVSEHGLKQLRLAETEKYAHVTYFFNGGVENPYPGEDRILVQSPLVPTYDQAPAMSAAEVTDQALAALAKQDYSFIVINYANPDMVGHTGNYQATIQAIETVDTCMGRLISGVVAVGGTTLIMADHGNAEVMWDEQGNPWTAHTTNQVPFILVEGEGRKIPGFGTHVNLRTDGTLADVAPTILQLLNLPQPLEMTGQSMINAADYQVQSMRSPVGMSL